MSDDNETTDDGAVEYGKDGAVDFAEIEARNTVTAAPDFSKITLDGDDVPAQLKGKTVADAIAYAKGLTSALELSENARLALKNSSEALLESRTSSRQSAPPPAAPAEPAQRTPEEWKQLFDEDPFAYNEAKATELERRVLSRLDSAVAPLAGSASEITQRDAKTRYPDEFAALGKEITEMIASLPDRTALANPGAMDELVAYARGKHFTKYMEYLDKKRGVDLESARSETASRTPPDLSTTSQRKNSKSKQLDDTEKEIARALGVSYDDYLKHK